MNRVVGISSGYMGQFGVAAPANRTAPSGANPVTNSQERPWYSTGPVWVLLFLVVGYLLVFRTLR